MNVTLEYIRPDVILVRVCPDERSPDWHFGCVLDVVGTTATARLARFAPTIREWRALRQALEERTDLTEVTWERRTIRDTALCVRLRRAKRQAPEGA